jgi:hypothetical protein
MMAWLTLRRDLGLGDVMARCHSCSALSPCALPWWAPAHRPSAHYIMRLGSPGRELHPGLPGSPPWSGQAAPDAAPGRVSGGGRCSKGRLALVAVGLPLAFLRGDGGPRGLGACMLPPGGMGDLGGRSEACLQFQDKCETG